MNSTTQSQTAVKSDPVAKRAFGSPAPEASSAAPHPGDLLYRFEGRLTEIYPVGLFPEGLRLANKFEGTVIGGPLAGARVWGIDQFIVRPDGVGVLDAPETFSRGALNVVGQVRGYALPPEGAPAIPLEAMLDPGFEWPDVPFRLRGSVMFRAAPPELEWMNRTVA
ncbi:MAG: hypothetical protein PVF33_02290, partial [Candidatus Latescibacterota bacterium]